METPLQPLRLEYACTDAELTEAQSLSIRKQIGGGSKWLSVAMLSTMLVVVLVGMVFMVRHETPPLYRPYAYAGLVILFIVVSFRNRRKKTDYKETNTLEVSDAGISVVAGKTQVWAPWSGIGECLESSLLFVLIDRSKLTLLVIPKRVFPNLATEAWFRALATATGNRVSTPISLISPATMALPGSDQITIRFQLGFRDYIDRTLASWSTYLGLIAFVVLAVGSFIYAAAHPIPHPVNSTTKVFLMVGLPLILFGPVMIFFTWALFTWFSHRPYLIPQELSVSEESLTSVTADGSATVPWTTYTYYKETGRSFIMWSNRNAWMLIPKHAFASIEEQQRCRSLFSRHLRQSRWFF